jgi:tetratricopeptide (TPR) repeat protein
MAWQLSYQRLRAGILACLLLSVSSSSFLLNQYLTNQITAGLFTETELEFALAHNNEAAMLHAWHKSIKHSQTWLVLAKQIAKTQGKAAYQLALFYQEQYSTFQAITWYKQAIRLKFTPAYVSLAKYYFEQEHLAEADEVINRLSLTETDTSYISVQILKIHMAITRGETSRVEQKVARLSEPLKSSEQGRELLKKIKKYQVLNVENIQKDLPLCANSIQLFATNFAHLQRLESLIKGIKQHTLSEYVCFSPVRYIAIDSLACVSEKARAIQCNEKNWQYFADSINTRFVGLLLPEGGANVYMGALYIDANDTLDVFIHEVSHLLGFVDEYALAEDHVVCSVIQHQAFSENIAVLANTYQGSRNTIRAEILRQLAWGHRIKDSTPILQLTTGIASTQSKQWLLGTPSQFEHEIGVFTSKTCSDVANNNESLSFNAYKPVMQSTKMQYYSLDFPKTYLSFLQENSSRFLMPSFHYNIALAYFQEGNVEQASYWFKQSASWERESSRKERILQGSF